MKSFRAVILLTLCTVSLLSAQTEIPVLQQRVTDFTNSLSFAEWKALEGKIKQFEDSTSTQVAVLLINSLEGGSIEDYSIRAFEKNKIGQEKKDNGVLIVVAKEDRLVRIEVGYGLEGVLTDALSSQIIRREILPRFKEGNFYVGLSNGVDAIMAAAAGEYKADRNGRNAPFIASALLLFGIIFFFGFFVPMLTSRRKAVIGSSNWMYYSGWGSMSGGRGGSSFGNWGGFSGGGWSGGGGMGGGGGATGRW